jgi:hypothetical protein
MDYGGRQLNDGAVIMVDETFEEFQREALRKFGGVKRFPAVWTPTPEAAHEESAHSRTESDFAPEAPPQPDVGPQSSPPQKKDDSNQVVP